MSSLSWLIIEKENIQLLQRLASALGFSAPNTFATNLRMNRGQLVIIYWVLGALSVRHYSLLATTLKKRPNCR